MKIIIYSGLTTKQNSSIKKEIMELVNRGEGTESNEMSEEYFKEVGFKEGMNNIVKFLCASRGKSLIVPERDLFK